MGRAAAVLSPLGLERAVRRALAFVVLLAFLATWLAIATRLPNMLFWADAVLVSVVFVPAAFGLVLLVLPLRRSRGLLPVGLAFAALVAATDLAGLDAVANLGKLAAATAIGFWFLDLFERLSWVVLVAAIIPAVDAVSVWRGPTQHIVTERPEVFDTLSFAFPGPGIGTFNLGLPDLLFFAVFLAAADRFGLRVRTTWAAMTASFGLTLGLAIAFDPFGLNGLPALPGLSLAFLAANADLLRRRLRGRPEEGDFAIT